MRVKLHTTDLGIPNCWFSIGRLHASIHDLISSLRLKFDLPEIQLEIDGFLLLENEATIDVLRENDLIHVLPKSRKRIKNEHLEEEVVNDLTQPSDIKVPVIVTDEAKLESSNDSSDTSSDESSSDPQTRKDSESSSSDSSSESGEDSSMDSEETVTQEMTLPPVMSSLINPPMSLVGKNKRKLVPKMLDQERVHLHFDGLEKKVEATGNADDVVFSQVVLYDNEPQKQVLSASQKRRIRRKKALIYKTLEAFNPQTDEAENPKVEESQIPLNSQHEYETLSKITSISSLRQGMKVAYQILVMSQSYQPEISNYREALVMAVDSFTKMITLKNLEIQENVDQPKIGEEEVSNRKFDLPPDDDFAPQEIQDDILVVAFHDLISVKIIE